MTRNIGVYALSYKNEIVYIGCSKNIASRVGGHYTKGSIVFDSWKIIPLPQRKESMFDQESRMIRKYNPIYNVKKKRKAVKIQP